MEQRSESACRDTGRDGNRNVRLRKLGILSKFLLCPSNLPLHADIRNLRTTTQDGGLGCGGDNSKRTGSPYRKENC